MNFASDNVTGISPAILEAIARANDGAANSYGADDITERLHEQLEAMFEHELVILPVATGTAANALALATLTPPWGAVLCHEEAHINVDEANSPEFYTGGAKLVTVPGADGKIDAASLAKLLPGGLGVVHHAQPAAVSITQATECGTLYQRDEIAEIAKVAHHHGLKLHMDGARFANAIAALGLSPSEATWRAGVDALSLGATKNGALAAEVVILFDIAKRPELEFRRKRGGHLFSKMRFLSAQLEAYFAEDLWLANARHANAMAARLARGLAQNPESRQRHPVEANEIFIELPEKVVAGLIKEGYHFYRWDGPASNCIRLVTAWNTAEAAVDRMIETARSIAQR
ncbi:MAG TPA: low specificity L-threonine aldolase [Aliidongia sp.]|nr:low specificity L-threonine aldolase [Aliidongia sp.]